MVDLASSPTLTALAGLIADRVTVTAVTRMVRGAAAIAAGQMVIIRARSSGDVVLELVGGGTVAVPVERGETELPLAVTRFIGSGSTADADVYSAQTNGTPFVKAQELIAGAAAIAPGSHVLVNCQADGEVAFALPGGGTLPRTVSRGPSLFALSANQLVASGTNALVRVWSLSR